MPKEHVIRFYEMDDDALVHLFRVVKIVARKIRKVFTPDFVCLYTWRTYLTSTSPSFHQCYMIR